MAGIKKYELVVSWAAQLKNITKRVDLIKIVSLKAAEIFKEWIASFAKFILEGPKYLAPLVELTDSIEEKFLIIEPE